MAILYPPYIEGKLPAQQGDTISIPFSFNRAGGFSNLGGMFELKIRTVATDGNPLGENNTLTAEYYNQTSVVHFPLGAYAGKLMVGQYYKVQMRLVEDAENASVYSTVGIFKYIEIGTIKIMGLEQDTINNTSTSYQGAYQFKVQEPDGTYRYINQDERVAWYKFDIYRGSDLIETSGWLQHKTQTDTYDSYTQLDIYTPKTNVETRELFGIQYHVKTLNNYTLSSPLYLIKHAMMFAPQVNLALSCTNHYDEGYISLNISLPDASVAEVLTGKFILWREEEGSNVPMERIQTILLDKPFFAGENLMVFQDRNIEHGKTYTYFLQQTSTDSPPLFTNKIPMGSVTAKFEDAFLWDKDKCLRLRYNPKISSIKDTILEQKMDTIGSKYPFFFRNGNVKYKEFPISALIAQSMNATFGNKVRTSTPDVNKSIANFDTDLVDENILNERKFKMEVLEWLNNGKPKIFTSPQEGKYLVRLNGVSLSPMEQLGRMLHTFNATAYEIGPCDYTHLNEQGIVSLESEFLSSCKVVNVILPSVNSQPTTYQCVSPALKARVRQAYPGTHITATFSDGTIFNGEVGSTGYYEIFIKEHNPLVSVSFSYSKLDTQVWVPATSIFDGRIPNQNKYDVCFEYVYLKEPIYYIYYNKKPVVSVKYSEVVDQVVGKGLNTKQILVWDEPHQMWISQNVLADSILDPDLANIMYIRIQHRDLIEEDWRKTVDATEEDLEDCYKFCIHDDDSVFPLPKISLDASGRIEYTYKEFDGYFCPKGLALGVGLYADIFYGKTTIETKED